MFSYRLHDFTASMGSNSTGMNDTVTLTGVSLLAGDEAILGTVPLIVTTQ